MENELIYEKEDDEDFVLMREYAKKQIAENKEEINIFDNKNHHKKIIHEYKIINITANKSLINSALRDRNAAFVNTLCYSERDITIALDTNTDLITLCNVIKFTKGMLGKMKEKKIFIHIGIFNDSFLINLSRLIDLNGTKILCVSTQAKNFQELRTEKELKYIFTGIGMKNKKIEKIMQNWRSVIKRRIIREGGMGKMDRHFITDFIQNKI